MNSEFAVRMIHSSSTILLLSDQFPMDVTLYFKIPDPKPNLKLNRKPNPNPNHFIIDEKSQEQVPQDGNSEAVFRDPFYIRIPHHGPHSSMAK